MSIAVTGAFLIGHWPEAAMVMVLFTLSEIIEQSSLEKASSAIEKLFSLSPDTTAVLTDGQWLSVKTEQVQKGDIVRVRAGERISLDGVIVKGDSSIDHRRLQAKALGLIKQSVIKYTLALLMVWVCLNLRSVLLVGTLPWHQSSKW